MILTTFSVDTTKAPLNPYMEMIERHKKKTRDKVQLLSSVGNNVRKTTRTNNKSVLSRTLDRDKIIKWRFTSPSNCYVVYTYSVADYSL